MWFLPLVTSAEIALAEPTGASLDAAVVSKLKKGTVLIRTTTGEGSGFFIRDEYILTNRHVVEDVGTNHPVEVVLDSGTRDGIHASGIVVDMYAQNDLALVHVPGIKGRNLVLGDDTTLFETQPVVAIGFPMGSVRALGGASADPPVSIRPGAVTALHQGDHGLMYVEHNANMQQGNSGGPLVDMYGAVVGVNVAMLTADQTTKLAIPATEIRAYLDLLEGIASRQAPAVASADPIAPNTPTIRTEVARPFEQGLVQEISIGAAGEAFVLFTNGEVRLLRNELDWYDLGSGTNNLDIASDDANGTLYAVQSDTGHIVKHKGGTEWELWGDGTNTQVAVSQGNVWSLGKDGSVMRHNGQAWLDLEINGVDGIVACAGKAYLQAKNDIWVHDGTNLTTTDGPVWSGVRTLVCHQHRTYGLMADGTVRDLARNTTIDTSTNNEHIWATPTGLLAWTKQKELWFYDSDGLAWSMVRSPETSAGSNSYGGVPQAPQESPHLRMIHVVSESRLPELRTCYEERATAGQAVDGTWTLEFSVASDGSVSQARAKGSSSDPTLEQCMVVKLRTWRYQPIPEALSVSENISFP